MRELRIKLASGRTEVVTIADSLFTLKTGVFEKIVEEWNPELTPDSAIYLFSILTGRDYSDYISSTDAKLERIILESTKFIYEGAFLQLEKLEMPSTLLGVSIPLNLGELTLGQNLHVKNKLANVKDIRSALSFVTAVYLQPLLDKSVFDDKRISYYEQQLKGLPVTQVYPIGFFLLSRLVNSGSWLTRYSSQMKRAIRSDLKNVKNLLNRLIRLLLNTSSH